MREYASISPRFWIGDTGRKLRGNPEAQVLALYLMSNHHTNMIGVYHCTLGYMAEDMGLTLKKAQDALRDLVAAGFCEYGLTERAIESKIARQDWIEGKQYHKAPDGRIYVDMRGFEKWVTGESGDGKKRKRRGTS